MNEKIKITICLGSSCFSRGNGNTLEIIRKFLNENNLTDKVDFKGQLCAGDCSHSPIIHINEEKFETVSESNILQILNKYLTEQNTIS